MPSLDSGKEGGRRFVMHTAAGPAIPLRLTSITETRPVQAPWCLKQSSPPDEVHPVSLTPTSTILGVSASSVVTVLDGSLHAS
jgi:hypothetical protein